MDNFIWRNTEGIWIQTSLDLILNGQKEVGLQQIVQILNGIWYTDQLKPDHLKNWPIEISPSKSPDFTGFLMFPDFECLDFRSPLFFFSGARSKIGLGVWLSEHKHQS